MSIAHLPTPILNTPDFEKVFGSDSLPLDEKGLLRPLEMIAFPGTLFRHIAPISDHIAQVEIDDYPAGPLYIDTRFTTQDAPPREKILPPSEEILGYLESSVGLPYIWGGNYREGIPLIAKLYNPSKIDDPHHILRGLDCSGLLFEATNGFSPRNTSELFSFGRPVENFTNVKPLDIIVFPGHVIICISSTYTIESLYGHGVIITPLSTRIQNLPKKNVVIRRFSPNINAISNK